MAIEHFGYIDGRSQPLFYQQDLQKEITDLDGEDPTLPGADQYLRFDPSAAKELVLVSDPLVPGNRDAFGSYFVFRKLEQDVRGFKQQEQALADKLGLVGESREIAGAYIVGRFEDGTPIVLRDEDGLRSPILNKFNYASDPTAQKCPFHSHLRKMNPRGDTVRAFAKPAEAAETLRQERGRRIARRGINTNRGLGVSFSVLRDAEPQLASQLARTILVPHGAQLGGLADNPRLAAGWQNHPRDPLHG